jgi:hypothetical protein
MQVKQNVKLHVLSKETKADSAIFPKTAAIMEQTKGRNNWMKRQTIDTGLSNAMRITDKQDSSTKIPAKHPTNAPKETDAIQFNRLCSKKKYRISPLENIHWRTVAKEICKFLLFVYYTPDVVEIQGDSKQICHFCKL